MLLRKAGIVIPSVSRLSCVLCSCLGPVLAKPGLPGFYSKNGGGLISGISFENRPTHMNVQNVLKESVNHIHKVFWTSLYP